MPSPDEGSLDVVLDYVRSEYLRQADHHERLATRSGTLLGFSAAVVALAGLGSAGGAGRYLVVAGVVLLVAAVVLFASVLGIRPYRGSPNVAALSRKYLDKPADQTKHEVIKATLEAIRLNNEVLHKVEGRYTWALRLAVLGAAATAAGIICATF